MAGWLNSVSNQNNSDSASPHVSVSTWGLGLRRGGFATLTLGPAGWLALLSPGVVIGLLVARLSGGSFALFGIIGGLAIWFAAVSVERLFAGHRPMSFVVDPSLSAEELERALRPHATPALPSITTRPSTTSQRSRSHRQISVQTLTTPGQTRLVQCSSPRLSIPPG